MYTLMTKPDQRNPFHENDEKTFGVDCDRFGIYCSQWLLWNREHELSRVW